MYTFQKTEEEKSALEAAMAATLAALEPPAGEPKKDPSKDGREGGKGGGGGGGGGRAGSGSEKQMVFKDKKEAMEALKDLLRERNVPSTANWEAAVKAISKDPRYEYLSKLTEKKQVGQQTFSFVLITSYLIFLLRRSTRTKSSGRKRSARRRGCGRRRQKRTSRTS